MYVCICISEYLYLLWRLQRGDPLPPVDFIVANIPKPLSMTCGWKNGIARATAQLPCVRISASCFFVKKSYLGERLRDCKFFAYFEDWGWYIRHFVFFTHAECAQQKCLRILSVRWEMCYACWACAKKMFTHIFRMLSQHRSNFWKLSKHFMHAECTLKNVLRMR